MLNNTNFEKLKIFYVVYKNRSIQRAAEELNVTRSAISQSLKQLEGEMGVSFFLRDSKKFQPTSQADELYRIVEPFVNELTSTLQSFESGRKTIAGHIRVGAPLDFGSGHLTKLIAQFRQRYPQVSFELVLATPIKQLHLLTQGALDLAFIDNGDIHAQEFPVKTQSIAKEDFVMVSSAKNYKDWKLKDANVSALIACPIVDYLAHAPVARMWFQHHFGKKNLNLDIVYSAESVRAVLNAIQKDIGIGVVARQLLVGEFADLKEVNTVKKPFINEILLAQDFRRKPMNRELEFIKFINDRT
jgi:DNA-binding transcriptional LysR family regulator